MLKTLAVHTGSGSVLAVIPASCRLDLPLVRDALGDHQARLASEEELATQELFASEQITTVPPVKQAERGSDDLIRRRRASQQDLTGGGNPAS